MSIMLVIYAAALACLNGYRIFDSTYWYDEMFSIMLIRMPVPDLLARTAKDVHPPLYYLILKTICHFFGETGPVLHAVSLLPYILVLILSLTVIRKRFGKSTAFLFITLTSLLQNAIRYNVEIRMYSWVVFFVLVSYLSLYEILYRNKARDYVIFVLSSLAAAYSHYYALIAVAFFYAILMLYALIVRKEIVRRVVIVWISTVAGYLGWLVVLIRTFQRTSSGWWLSWMPKFRQSFAAIFSGKYSWVLFYAYVAVISLCALIWIIQIASGKEDTSGRVAVNELVWFAAGAASVFGTIAVGIGVSHLFRPLYFDRYIYTAAVCAWLTLSVGASRFRIRGIAPLSILLTLFVCWCGYFNYMKVYQQDQTENLETEATVQFLQENTAGAEGAILTEKGTDMYIMIYFPKCKREQTDQESLENVELPGDGNVRLYVASGALEADTIEKLAEKGIRCREIRPAMFDNDPDRGGFLGDLNIWVYELSGAG